MGEERRRRAPDLAALPPHPRINKKITLPNPKKKPGTAILPAKINPARTKRIRKETTRLVMFTKMLSKTFDEPNVARIKWRDYLVS